MKLYAYPHECETWEVAQALAPLDVSQRRVLRSYVANVVYGEMSLEAWAGAADVPRVALSTWRKPGGRYWGTDEAPNNLFRDAVEKMVSARETWISRRVTLETTKALEALSLGLSPAAKRVVSLVDEGENDRIRLDAAKDILNRFGATAEKAVVSSSDKNELSDEERAERIASLLDSARARRDGQAAGDGREAVAAAAGAADEGAGDAG